jgi:hypothetical protein
MVPPQGSFPAEIPVPVVEEMQGRSQPMLLVWLVARAGYLDQALVQVLPGAG